MKAIYFIFTRFLLVLLQDVFFCKAVSNLSFIKVAVTKIDQCYAPFHIYDNCREKAGF